MGGTLNLVVKLLNPLFPRCTVRIFLIFKGSKGKRELLLFKILVHSILNTQDKEDELLSMNKRSLVLNVRSLYIKKKLCTILRLIA